MIAPLDYADLAGWQARLTHAVPDVASQLLSHLADQGQVATLAQVLPIARSRAMALTPFLMAALSDRSVAVAEVFLAHWSDDEPMGHLIEKALNQGLLTLVPSLVSHLLPDDNVHLACRIAVRDGHVSALPHLIPHLDLHTPAMDTLLFEAFRTDRESGRLLLQALPEADQRAMITRIQATEKPEGLFRALDALASEVSLPVAETWVREATRDGISLPLTQGRLRAVERGQALAQRPTTATIRGRRRS